jgi:hypothetical protein
MASPRGQRIQASCQIIWGDGDYDIDIDNEWCTTYWASVKKDFGLSFGPPLIMTGICDSQDHAMRELDRMLFDWARQIRSGQPMTDNQSLKIFGGPRGENKPILKQFIALMEKHEKANSQ